MGPSHGHRSHSAARLQAVTAPLTQAASADARRVKSCRDCDQLETSRGIGRKNIPAEPEECGDNLGNDDHDDDDNNNDDV